MRIIPLLILVLSIASTGRLQAQNCGCAEEGNCPYIFPTNSVTQVCYDITDAFNNNLASPTQGVCGVSVRFRHGSIGKMELRLTAPNGTQVQLIGASGVCSPFTLVSTWDILFVQCSDLCAPDTITGSNFCAYPCRFDVCPPVCNWQNANYSGTYLPFAGCLEDFNTGPVNGQWCLDIVNTSASNGGRILDFEVILCDQSGFTCCDADAGNLAFEPDVSACIGDTSLLLSPGPIYGAVVPDTAEYGYTYTIFGNNMLLEYAGTPDLRGYAPGSYQVCGLSYQLSDSTNLPATGSFLSPAALSSNLTGPTPLFCGDIETNCITVNIASPPLPVDLVDTICVGDTAFIGSMGYTLSGLYADTLVSVGGCDSIVNLALAVVGPDTVSSFVTICAGEVYILGADTFSVPGVYMSTLQNRFGCDSLVVLDLTILAPISTVLTDTICNGDTVFVGPNGYTFSGVFTDTLTSYFNCDSIVTLDLTAVTVGVFIAPPGVLTCQLTSELLDATAATTLGTLSYQWTTVGGHFLGSTTGPTANVDDPGTYIVTVVSTGCSAADTVTVLEDAVYPVADAFAQATSTLTCGVQSIQLNGTGSSGNPGFTYQWAGLGGSPVLNPTSAMPTISAPDTYRLVVTNPDNLCQDTAIVVISQNITPPTANAGPDMALTCTVGSVTLDGSGSSAAGGLGYAWNATGGGNFISSTAIAMPQVNRADTYRLIVTDLVNTCRDTATVSVVLDTIAPQARITLPGPDSLTCSNVVVTVDGSASSGSNLLFQWAGNIASGQGSPAATATQPGNFSLILTDTLNGCVDTAFTTVVQDLAPPIAEAGPGGSVNCNNRTVTLGGAATSMGPQFAYQWTSVPAGLLPGPANTASIAVDSGGVFYLTVTNIANGCTAIDSTTVADTYDPPVANAGPDGILNCQTNSYTLDGSGSTIVAFTVLQWRDPAGTLIGNAPQVAVNAPGLYTLTVSFAFCSDTDTVLVNNDTQAPAANAGADAQLGCLSGQSVLDGTGSGSGAGFTVQWTTPDGSILSGSSTLTPTVDRVGTYLLTVTDTANQCSATDAAVVTLDSVACRPMVNAGADGSFNCRSQVFGDTLQASGPAGPVFTYQWTAISGAVINASNPFMPVVSGGQFVFTVTNNAVGLSASDTVLVVGDTILPLADAGPQFMPLNCTELAGCYQLDASNSSQGANFTYQWESLDGAFCSAIDVLNPEIIGEGLYNLEVTNVSNGCRADDAVFVQLLDFVPEALAGNTVQMACGDTTTVLDGSASSTGGNYAYEWFSLGGNIISGGNSTTPTVFPNNSQDTFYLVVLNTVNMCRDTDFVVVFAPANCFPFCQAAASGPITCATNTVTLDGTGSSTGADVTYQWTTPGGNFCGSANTLNTCADAPGMYQLTVTRTYPNGAAFNTNCSVQVVDNAQLPMAEAGPNSTLTCTIAAVTLSGTPSSSGPNFTYQWATANGNIVSGGATKTPQVNAPGTYDLLVTDTTTGCTATDFVTVGIDTLRPTAEAGPGDELTCASNNVVLPGSSNAGNAAFFWTTPTGNLCAGANTPNPVVCAAGVYFLRVTNPANGCTATDSTTVTQSSDFPTINTGQNLRYTCADTVFTINASASGTGVLGYQWAALNGGCISGPADVLQPTVACPGVYRLTVTDQANGCSANSQMEVLADNLPPVADAGSGQEINCSAFTVPLDGSASSANSIGGGPLMYFWVAFGNGHFVAGQTTASPTVDSAGIYQLTVTDQSNLCVDSASVTVTIDANIPLADAGPDTTLTCTRNSLELDGTGSSASPTITYSWVVNSGNIAQGGTTTSPTINQPGTYILQVEDTANNCAVADTVLVALDTAGPAALIGPNPQTLTCSVRQVGLDGSLSSPANGLGYHWTTPDGHILGGDNAANVLVDSGGTYLLTVTLARNGCTNQASMFVNEDLKKPDAIVAVPPVLDCNNSSVQLEILPPSPDTVYAFVWSGPSIVGGADSRLPAVDQVGLYTVTVTDTNNGCTNQGSVFVAGDFALPAVAANTVGVLDCDNLDVEITGKGSATGNVTYLWTTAAGNGSILDTTAMTTLVTAPGWYFLRVHSLDNGCEATDSTLVTASAAPIFNALITLDQPDCVEPEGAINIEVVYGGLPPFFYSLNDGIAVTTSQFSYLAPGAYEVTIEDPNGCRYSRSVVLNEPGDIMVELGDDHFIRQGQRVDLTALLNVPAGTIETVSWKGLPDSTACPACLEQTVAPLETTVYSVTVIDSAGCLATDKVTVWVNEERPFYVPTGFSPDGNGMNDLLVLYAGRDIERVGIFKIFDRWGNLVYSAKDFPPNDPGFGWDGTFDGKPMDPAVFVWMAEIASANGIREVYYGDVTLVR